VYTSSEVFSISFPEPFSGAAEGLPYIQSADGVKEKQRRGSFPNAILWQCVAF
jgi:hypothetical protein